MLFNSFVFLVFAAGFYSAWPLLRRWDTTRWSYLVVASFVFYGWWDWRFLFLILASGLIDYFAARGMRWIPARRHVFLLLSILGNVGSLAAFKYSGFLAENVDTLAAWLGFSLNLRATIPDFMLLMPVGISFYTFQSMSYTIDVYRGKLEPTNNILHFFAYLALFPQLVAGPVVRARAFLPQLRTVPSTTEAQRYDGLRLIVHGFFKKVVVADSIAPIVGDAFGSPAVQASSPFWWLIVTMFAVQIYCDFSGYSDIARGLAKWMGYEIRLNFDHPYIAQSLREFWQRWHISLSTWFRDYVYIPLGGSHVGRLETYRNLWITMLLSGLWHGAAWTFVAWAAAHSLFLSIERWTGWTDRLSRTPGGAVLSTVTVLTQVWIAWVFFRAESLGQAVDILTRMFAFDGTAIRVPDELLFLKACAVTALAGGREAYFAFGLNHVRVGSDRFRAGLDRLILAGMIIASVFLRGPGSAFIYFQF